MNFLKKFVCIVFCVVAFITLDTTPSFAENTLTYASHNYSRINPAMDEHGEINLLLFNGLVAHDGNNQIQPSLAEKWNYNAKNKSYTFYLRKDVLWHDGKPFTAKDVKFTIESIINPKNGSENAPNFEDVQSIQIIDDYTIMFTLSSPNVAFLDYMVMPILPMHCLENESMQESEFFLHPIGTGPYKIKVWEQGQAIVMEKNEHYFNGVPKIDTVVFKITEDDNAKALQLLGGEVNLAQLPPKATTSFDKNEHFVVYNIKTSDYRGIMYNFQNPYWKNHEYLIQAVNYAIDRETIVKHILNGHGEVAYGPLQRNVYGVNIDNFSYDPTRAIKILEDNGATKNSQGFYEKDGQPLGFVLNTMEGDQARIDIAQVVAQQLRNIGIDVKVEIPTQIDWENQMAFLIGWGSPFDADDHTYKVFGTNKGANYSGYSNPKVDELLQKARQSENAKERQLFYQQFQEEIDQNPPYTFICYIDADYVADKSIRGISQNTILGHHGVGIFWNINQWTIAK